MLNQIEKAIERINELSRDKPIKIISHYDSDGITSAAIFARALKRAGKRFSLKIVKGLDEEFVKSLSDDNILIFLDLGSGSLDYFKRKKTEIFIFDHHEIIQNIPENVLMINPLLHKFESISSSAICYLFARALSQQNKDLANLAVIGMIGDKYESNIGKIFSKILTDAECIIKKGLLIYPSTRPLDKALEYSFSPYIPGVSGSRDAVKEVLKEGGIINNGKYKALYELDENEMRKLITTIILKSGLSLSQDNLIGNLFLIKFFNKLEDARELSALINACSRMDCSDVALGFCLGNIGMKEKAEKIYLDYRQNIVSALKYVASINKIFGKDYLILNAKDKIKDTIIGTIASILSHSPFYPEGLIIVAFAYDGDKIKVSARIKGKENNGKNVREILSKVVTSIGGEVGGHSNAAGCLISREKENEFISELKNVLDVQVIKV